MMLPLLSQSSFLLLFVFVSNFVTTTTGFTIPSPKYYNPTLSSVSLAFRSTTTTSLSTLEQLQHQKIQRQQELKGKKSDDDDDEQTGMADAFAQLDELTSLGEDSDLEKQAIGSVKKEIKVDPDAAVKVDIIEVNASPEKEIELYKEMMSKEGTDLENDTYADIAEELKAELGASSSLVTPEQEMEYLQQNDDDIYSDILSDLKEDVSSTPPPTQSKGFGTPTTPKKKKKKPSSITETTGIDINTSAATNPEEFMNKALEEAMKEVKLKTPKEMSSLSESILNDKEIMKEITTIFDAGNEKLLESLEDIRKEQEVLVKVDSEKSMLKVDGQTTEEAVRLEEAQNSMKQILSKVGDETAEVEAAMNALKDAQTQMLSDPISKLVNIKDGGIIKQSALVGSILFTFRSISDLALGSGDIASAGIQALIAVLCIIYVVVF